MQNLCGNLMARHIWSNMDKQFILINSLQAIRIHIRNLARVPISTVGFLCNSSAIPIQELILVLPWHLKIDRIIIGPRCIRFNIRRIYMVKEKAKRISINLICSAKLFPVCQMDKSTIGFTNQYF